jgi:hypothetical protein
MARELPPHLVPLSLAAKESLARERAGIRFQLPASERRAIRLQMAEAFAVGDDTDAGDYIWSDAYLKDRDAEMQPATFTLGLTWCEFCHTDLEGEALCRRCLAMVEPDEDGYDSYDMLNRGRGF